MGAAALLDLDCGGGGGGVVVDAVAFYVAMAWLYVMCVLIFAASAGDDVDGSCGAAQRRIRGPVFVGGKGCPCGGCRAGAGVCVCGTYLS